MSKPVAIIDLRSDSVGGALVEPRFDSARRVYTSRLIKLSRQPLVFQTELNHERFFADLVTALKRVLTELFASPRARPEQITCFMSAPFYAAQTRTIKQTRPKPVVVDQTLVAELVKSDLKNFEETTPPLYREIIHDAHELIEHKIMQIKLNRYFTRSPYGKRASEIEISHYLSVSSAQVLNRLREVLVTYLDGRQITFHSFPFVFFTVSRDWFEADRALLLDLGGEVTEVSLIADGVLWETVSFPLGHNFLIRRLAAEFKTVPEEVLSALKIYQRGGHNKLTNERLAAALALCQAEWLSTFKNALSALTETHFGSNRLLAVGDPVVTPIVLDWIKVGSYEELFITPRSFNVSILTDREFARTAGAGDREGWSGDPQLLLETIFYDRLLTLRV